MHHNSFNGNTQTSSESINSRQPTMDIIFFIKVTAVKVLNDNVLKFHKPGPRVIVNKCDMIFHMGVRVCVGRGGGGGVCGGICIRVCVWVGWV